MASVDNAPISINDRLYRTVREGKANILAPYKTESKKAKKGPSQPGQPRNNDEGDQAVFYNPIQQYNRDISVQAIRAFGEDTLKARQVKKSNQNKNRRQKASKLKQAQSTDNASKKRSADQADLDVNGVDDEVSKKARNEPRTSDADVQGTKPEPSDDVQSQPQPENAVTVTEGLQPVQDRQPKSESFTILDALSASGLRAIRYAKEIPFATTVVANDLLPEAVEAINLNIEHNELKDKVYSNVGDARKFMYSKTGNETPDQGPGYVHRFDVIDLDPYGTAAPFLDSAIQAVADGGMLCVTCTDAGVWASNGYPEKAFALYAGIPLKGPHSHEAGLRLILHSIAISAAKYGIAIEPLLSLSIDFYARVFVRVHKSQQDVKLMAGTTMLVYSCDTGCGAWELQMAARNQVQEAKNGEKFFKHGFSQGPSTDHICQHCGSKTHLGGPMWAGPLHNPQFIRKMLNNLESADKTVYGTTDRMKGMLTVALEEENIEWPAKKKSATDKDAVMTDEVQIQTKEAEKFTNADLITRMPPQLISQAPFFFLPTYLAKVLSLPTPAEDPLRGAFLALGYQCTRSHCKPGSFKTNAPWKVIWEIMREFARQKELNRIPRLLGEGEFKDKPSVRKSGPGYHILKRLRGRTDDSLRVAQIREAWVKKLGLGHGATDFQTISDLQDAFKSALYELEHPSRKESPVEDASVNGNRSKTNGGADESQLTEAQTNGKTQPAKISGKALIEAGGDVSELDIVFDANLGRAFRESKSGKLVRYQINPRANWGPMVRAGTGNG